MNQVLRARIAHAPAGTLAAAFRDLPDGVDELRVALSAGYDTTAHTLAWLLAHVAQQPRFRAPRVPRRCHRRGAAALSGRLDG